MAKWLLKACPKCRGGDIYINKDLEDNLVETCLQCGHTVEIKAKSSGQAMVEMGERLFKEVKV